MKIDRNNYEGFFIDYLEGNLDESMVNDFIEFIQKNPDMKEELSMFDSVLLEPEEMAFEKKDSLYKEKYDVEKVFNHAAVAKVEGDLPVMEEHDFEDYLSRHPEKEKEVALFAKMKLRPDKNIVFQHKKTLYHYSAGRTILLWTSRIAAVLIFAAAVYIFIDSQTENQVSENQLARAENSSETTEKPAEKSPVPSDKNAIEDEPPEETEAAKTEAATVQQQTNSDDKKAVRVKPETISKATAPQVLADRRIPAEPPAKLQSVEALVTASKPETALAEKKVVVPENNLPKAGEEVFLADVVKEKTGLDKLSFSKITKAGLNLVSSLSKEKFTYETNENGKVTEVNFDTRLLAFSIPTKNEENGE